MTSVSVQKIAGHVGAEVSGVDLNTLSDDVFDAIRVALLENGVIVFRDQALTPEGHIAFAERWGKIDVNRFFQPVEGYPKIAEVRTEPHQNKVIGGSWHTDHSYDPAPAMASILCAREVPDYGGDTCFASMTAAFAALSPGMQAMLEGLKAWHSDATFGVDDDGRFDTTATTKPTRHPVVIRHPETGEKSLYVNGDFTTHFDGWTVEESKPLLEYLYAFATRAEFCCRVRWEAGTVAMWENRLVHHLAVADYQGQARLMHRITVEGVPLS